MTFSFHHTARAELDDAIDYYEDNEPGLGYEFLEEVYAAITLIVQYPSAWSQLSRRTRRCIMKRFPYELIYQVVEGEMFPMFHSWTRSSFHRLVSAYLKAVLCFP